MLMNPIEEKSVEELLNEPPPEVHASVRDIKALEETLAWQDICAYIRYRMAGTLIVLKRELDPRALHRAQGALEVAETILNLPTELIDLIKTEDELEQPED